MALRWATAAAAIALAVALPATAAAGGFATLGLSSLPDGTAPGRPWHVTLTILQHGRPPMADLTPAVGGSEAARGLPPRRRRRRAHVRRAAGGAARPLHGRRRVPDGGHVALR